MLPHSQTTQTAGLSDFDPTFFNCFLLRYSPLISPYDNSQQTIKFSIGANDDPLYSDLSTLKCVGRLQVQHSDGSALEPDEAISIVNCFPESIFSQINVYLNGLPVSDHGRGTNLKSYVFKHFSCSEEVKRVNLKNDYYEEDVTREGEIAMEQITLDTLRTEPGLRRRALFIERSKDVFFNFRPTFDLMTCEQALPPSYVLNLEFERAPESFSLLTAADNQQQYKIRLYDFHLELRRFLPSQKAISSLPSPRTGTHYLPFTRNTVRFRAIHAGVQEYTIPQISDGAAVLPYHIMVFCLTNDQTTNITKNPYIYWPHLVTKYNLLLNSTSLPSERISLSTNWLDNTRAYGHFLENNTLGGLHSTNGVSPFTFRYRDFCMSWNLNPDLCGNMHRHRWKDTKKLP